MAPQQIVALTPEVAACALLDQWGRAHFLGATADIGRTIKSTGLMISDIAVSRQHACFQRASSEWVLRDVGSSNGTFVNRAAVLECPLIQGDQVEFGGVGFYVLLDIGLVASPQPEELPAVITGVSPQEAPLRTSSLRILEPTGGNGGLVELANAQAQLTATQLELVEIHSRKLRQDAHLPLAVRGYVRSSELVGALSWDAHDPDETHVKQLVRRVRRTLVRCGLGDLIESRHRLGYRLRVDPAVSSA